jgi:2-polyprenyl-3-methyl-5-hydroxy-6-metoxy-1,4-benzoquinol methylase
MNKVSLEPVLSQENRPFVDFYMEHDVIPTRQDISNLTRHLERRSALYRSLGIIPSFVAGRSVLEFGPGSGHNAVHTLNLHPSRFVLVDANRASLRSSRELTEEHKNSTDCEVVDCEIERFNTKERFDLVLCEGVVPTQINPSAFTRKVASLAKPGGVVVITCMDPVSVLPEILRRYLAQRLVPSGAAFQEKVKKLTAYFLPHMKTLKNMSRRPEDWVIDVVIHPWSGHLYSMATALEALKGIAVPHGSSPKFLSDWRWYKDVHGTAVFDLKQALKDYHSVVHTFLDFRSEVKSKNANKNLPLVKLCGKIYDRVYAVERKGKAYSPAEIAKDVKSVAAMIKNDMPETAIALQEFAALVKGVAPGTKSPFRHFHKLWGRGQQYVSFIVQE